MNALDKITLNKEGSIQPDTILSKDKLIALLQQHGKILIKIILQFKKR